ncbi:DUF6804 family protein [Croceicoccus gelatinilyticus]|uniref:DUF6804 family protein n=1 Tax=Croceicoccus gelatinilyticus TaxID=2835536 RepID=UPI001BCC5220|nr:DUF6804 family protein [Croceicoccus gelatinilyticus]MBS7671717.1 hypothetical protein [Croceicoccus gelatinilyticus]
MTGKTLVAPPDWLAMLLIALLFLGIAEMPSGFGLLMRIAVTGYALYTALRVFMLDGNPMVGWAFIFTALLYNPVFRIAADREAWILANILTLFLVAAERFVTKRV